MAINLADDIRVQAPKSLDSKYLNRNTNLPYTGVTQVAVMIPSGERHIGLTTNINGVEYWYKNDTTNLILKTAGGTLTGATNGIHLINGGTTVALGDITTFSGATFNGGFLNYLTHPSFTTNTQIIDKQYADDIVSGLKPKEAVKVATVGYVNLASPPATIDTLPMLNFDRVLIKNQGVGNTGSTQNGIYNWHSSGMTRSADFDGMPASETVSGTYVWVLTGGTNENTAWVLDTPDPIILTGLTPSVLSFVQFSSIPAINSGTGITVTQSTGQYYISVSTPYRKQIFASLTGATGTNIGTNGRNVCLTSTADIVLGGAMTGTTGSYIGTSGRNVCLNSVSQAILGSALTGATNGLSLSGRNVCLGGSLTGQTIIDTNAQNLAIYDTTGSYMGIALNGNGNGTFGYTNMDGGYIQFDNGGGISMSASGGSWMGMDGASDCVTLGNTIGSCFELNGDYLVMQQGGGSIISIDTNSDIYLSTSGGTVISISAATNSVDITGTVTLQSTPASGTTSDSVIVWNSSDKQLKTVAGSSLGEHNNIYTKTVVTDDTLLTTGSTYAILVQTGATVTITLPATPIDGQAFKIKDAGGNALTHNIIIAGNGNDIDGVSSDATINTDGGALELMFDATLGSWEVLSFVN